MTRPPFDPSTHDNATCPCWERMSMPWCECACHDENDAQARALIARPDPATGDVTRLMTDPAARVHLAAALGVVVGMLTMTLATLLALVVNR